MQQTREELAALIRQSEQNIEESQKKLLRLHDDLLKLSSRLGSAPERRDAHQETFSKFTLAEGSPSPHHYPAPTSTGLVRS